MTTTSSSSSGGGGSSGGAGKQHYATFKEYRGALERAVPDNRAALLPEFRKADNHATLTQTLLKVDRAELVETLKEVGLVLVGNEKQRLNRTRLIEKAKDDLTSF